MFYTLQKATFPHQIHTSSAYLFLKRTLFLDSFSVAAITAVINQSSFISLGNLPIQTRTRCITLCVSSSTTCSLLKIAVDYEAAFALVANLTSPVPDLWPPSNKKCFFDRSYRHSFISSDIISILLELVTCVWYTTASSVLSPTASSRVATFIVSQSLFIYFLHLRISSLFTKNCVTFNDETATTANSLA